MENYQDKLRLAAIFILCLLNIGFGLHAGQSPMLLGGVIGLGYVATVATTGRTRPHKTISTPES